MSKRLLECLPAVLLILVCIIVPTVAAARHERRTHDTIIINGKEVRRH